MFLNQEWYHIVIKAELHASWQSLAFEIWID
jgi:hypothetical protein